MDDDFNILGEILQDVKSNNDERPWRDKKMNGLKVSDSFRRLQLDKRAERTRYCGSFLEFSECANDGRKKLISANFCRDRLCPMCNWRRSGMLRGQILEILHSAVQEEKLKFIFLTLTIKNPMKDELSRTIDIMFDGFNRLFKYQKVNNVIVGWVRVLEVTRNNNKNSKNYDTYHPHFHVLMAVRPSYFKGNGYIRQEFWGDLWQKALRVDYRPHVGIEVVRPKRVGETVESAVAETAKYTVKESDYIHDDIEEMDSVVEVLASSLKNRRLIGYGKIFKDVKAKLKLQDVESETADLIGNKKKECNCVLCGSILNETLYKWHMGYRNYVKIEKDTL